ncbi:hypothetical protein HJD18_15555 [Thermoleophilia bacterium SCSIO 60948]|nr:hypothetical protein HJD18_15555 [Thermoleophilia bacterium SCSIO 60948]
MDRIDDGTLPDINKLILVTTDIAPEGTASALLRAGDDRDVESAERLLLDVATEDPGPKSTAESRERFREADPKDRKLLLAKIDVRDSTSGVGNFRPELRRALGPFALPSVGTEECLDKLVGWWERRAVDLLLRRRRAVTRAEVIEEVVRLRDEYGTGRLPAADPALAEELSETLLRAYADAPFVRQLELIAMHDERVQLAVSDYHRAYAQRSQWLEQGVLLPEELAEWEARLFDEWNHAWLRMLDELQDPIEEPAHSEAGKRLYGEMEASSLNPLRDGRDRFLHVGTLNGMADVCRIGWHPDFRARMQRVVEKVVSGASTDQMFRRARGMS